MRSSLRRRIEVLEIVNQKHEVQRVIISYTEPFNFWDVIGSTVEGVMVERHGDFNDYQTLIDLKIESVKMAKTIIKGCGVFIKVEEVLKDGARHQSYYDYEGIIPNISNTHLCKFSAFKSAYDKALEIEGLKK